MKLCKYAKIKELMEIALGQNLSIGIACAKQFNCYFSVCSTFHLYIILAILLEIVSCMSFFCWFVYLKTNNNQAKTKHPYILLYFLATICGCCCRFCCYLLADINDKLSFGSVVIVVVVIFYFSHIFKYDFNWIVLWLCMCVIINVYMVIFS